jgi:uncharacterized protein
MGRSGKTPIFKRGPVGGVQTALWLLLALGLCALPLVAGSQNAPAASTARANHWLQRYNQAMDAYRAGDYAAAYTKFRALADFGSAGAQTMIGHLYWTGKGVEQAHSKAFLWFHRAAQRGYPPAQLALGRAYAMGHGIKQDKFEAALWLSLVESRGTPALQKQARQMLSGLISGFSAADRAKLDQSKRSWRPDVALMP